MKSIIVLIAMFIGLTSIQGQEIKSLSEKFEKVEFTYKELPGKSKLRIMLIGDSNTEGHGAYRLFLQDLLLQNDIEFDFIGIRNSNTPDLTPNGFKSDKDHVAFSGWRIHEVQNAFEEYYKQYTDRIKEVDIIFFMLGTNDMIADVGVHGPLVSPDTMAFENAPKNYESFLNSLFVKYPGVKIYVGNLLTTGISIDGDTKEQVKGLEQIQKNVISFNTTFIKNLPKNNKIKLNGGQLYVVDMFSLFQPDELENRFHPSIGSYKKIADCWFDNLRLKN
ncbi:SGNH/GDSL hydrolase family protein [Arenibacter certesii]|uniref:SGNH hydrolase-type esterase domain-containing protein n=1 Tax=Arenibacter certesii TaxID=228955 RepID=A0A918J4T9_9FLAO|nr:SGNH/GDSL hydrolase family protein [Arenibacter certesii]GGW48266.1 hypothetical protein GCM10007383_35430 [Arenibacter certesii]